MNSTRIFCAPVSVLLTAYETILSEQLLGEIKGKFRNKKTIPEATCRIKFLLRSLEAKGYV
jgi:hypothetical protein